LRYVQRIQQPCFGLNHPRLAFNLEKGHLSQSLQLMALQSYLHHGFMIRISSYFMFLSDH